MTDNEHARQWDKYAKQSRKDEANAKTDAARLKHRMNAEYEESVAKKLRKEKASW